MTDWPFHILVGVILAIPAAIYVVGLVSVIKSRLWVAVTIMALLPTLLAISGWIWLQSGDSEWGYRKALPKDTIEICEYRHADGFLPDHNYFLKAAIAESDFEPYVKKFGMTPHTTDRKYIGGFSGGPNWNNGPDWWKPSNNNSRTYSDQPAEDAWLFAKYENGYLYLHSYVH
jgi:hypothetical protein